MPKGLDFSFFNGWIKRMRPKKKFLDAIPSKVL